MFAEFTGVNPNAYVPLPSAEGIPSKAELDRRKTCVTERVKAIAREAGISPDTIANMEVTFTTTSLALTVGSASLEGKKIIINLSGLLLLDFKNDFLIQGPEDLKAKMANDQWLQEFNDKYCEIYNFLPIKINESDKPIKPIMKQLFSRLLNPEKEALAQLFVVLHELGHVHHRHINQTLFFSTICKWGTFIFIQDLIFAFVKKKNTSVVIRDILILLFLFSGFLYQKRISRKNEIVADQFALNAFKGEAARQVKEGAIHFFEKSIEEREADKKKLTRWQVFWKGMTKVSDHPASTSRLQMARQFVVT